MGWFLLRKPYPGLTEEQRIDILTDVILIGRGRECSVHCLSIFVSRRHLEILPKDDGRLNIIDLGSSNGTFVNQIKIASKVECPLNVGDEIGIGNIKVDDKDCYVYEVCLQENDKVVSSLSFQKGCGENLVTPDENRIENSNTSHHLDRGRKRFNVDCDEIIVLDVVEKEKGIQAVAVENMESTSSHSKKIKLHEAVSSDKPLKVKHTMLEVKSPSEQEGFNQSNVSEKEKVCSETVGGADKNVNAKGFEKPIMGHPPEQKQDFVSDTTCDVKCVSNSGDKIRNKSLQCKSHSSNLAENPIQLSDRRLSAILNETWDTSGGTVKFSSPTSVWKDPNKSSCSTPYDSKVTNEKEALPVLNSTPCSKPDTRISSMSKRDSGDLSPICNNKHNESRHSRESSFNYTLDDEVIPINVSDDEEIFPCSQMFEENLKPYISDVQKEVDLIDLSLEEEHDFNKVREDDDLNGVIVLGSSDEDDDEIEDVSRWYQRLSQSSIKIEADESTDLKQEHSDQKVFVKEHEDVEMGKVLPDRFNSLCDQDLEFDDIQKSISENLINVDGVFSKALSSKEKLQEQAAEIRKEKGMDHKRGKKHKKRNKEKERSKHKEDYQDQRNESKNRKQKSLDKEDDSHREKHSKSDQKHQFDTRDKKKKLDEQFDELRESCLKNQSDEDQRAQFLQNRSVASYMPSSSCVSVPSTSKVLESKTSKVIENLSQPSKSKLTEPRVYVKRLESDSELCEQYNLPSSKLPSPLQKYSPPPASHDKKGSRKIELVDALPNPPRKASNRAISSTTALKLFNSESAIDLTHSIHIRKTSKSVEIKNAKTLRKEKLAQVAALRMSKGKEDPDEQLKRAAPARVKNTKSNRGSFLTEEEKLIQNKPKSRKEIVRSIRIPKVKDRPTTIHPTKSPLEAMNMSWDKDKPMPQVCPTSSHASGIAVENGISVENEPVEIPTGPQPKKRIAQVPPPGFYRDSASPAQEGITLPAPIKSCLLGSSKHNIALNKFKASGPKKQVRFKENIEEVFLIEKLPNTRPLSSYKDADRPKAMSQIPSTKASAMAYDEAILQDVVYDISKWNPLWLKEEKDLPPDTLPPVVSNMNLPTIPPTEFLDFKEYHDSMYPLLMLELWNGVSKGYNVQISRSNMIMAVDSASSSAVFSRPDRMLTTLNCHMLVDERKEKIDHPRLGHLVMIDLAMKDSSGMSVVSPVFGYVSHDSKEPVFNHVKFHKDLATHCRTPTCKVRFSLQIRERRNFTFVLDKPMRIKNVKYIRGDLRVFQAMKNLEFMPLRYSIISPSSGNEDFTLPDVSRKALASAEQLNTIQTNTVLQTAEVCLEHKPKICLIQGPPGTGKSHVIISLVNQLLYRDHIYNKTNREKGLVPRILLCAPSNNAVDVLVKRLLRRRSKMDQQYRFKMVRVGQIENMHPDVKGISLTELAKIDVQRTSKEKNDSGNIDQEITALAARMQGLDNTIRDLRANNKQVPEEINFRQADNLRKLKILEERKKQQSKTTRNPNEMFALNREAMKKILRGADIVATTLTSCVIKIMESAFPPTRENKYNFQVCIVDEATQCWEVETLIPLMLGVKTLVLVGDPNQLPATVLSKVAKEKGLGTSLFARLQKIVPNAVQMLDVQYRMHPEILKWPNKYFYQSRLRTPDQFARCRESKIHPYSVISLPFQQDPQGESNLEESRFVFQLAELLIDKKAIPQPTFSVGIVTPYQKQFRSMKDMKSRLPHHVADLVEINTIDSYQGQEKDIIIFSCVRTSGVGFLSGHQRLNVALTRAKYALFMCGNFSSLDRDPMWNNLLVDARQRSCVIDLWKQPINKEDLWNLIKKN